MIEFVIAVFLLLITPGPGVLTTAGIGAAYGFRAGMRFIMGLCLGGFITIIMVISGLAAVVLAVPSLRLVLLIASVCYLVYLAWRIASAGSKIGFAPSTMPLGFTNGLTMQFINPKAYIVATTLFSGFNFLPQTPVAEVMIKIMVFHAIWVPVHLVWLGAGAHLRQMNLQPRTQRMINIGMAICLLAVVFVALAATQ